MTTPMHPSPDEFIKTCGIAASPLQINQKVRQNENSYIYDYITSRPE